MYHPQEQDMDSNSNSNTKSDQPPPVTLMSRIGIAFVSFWSWSLVLGPWSSSPSHHHHHCRRRCRQRKMWRGLEKKSGFSTGTTRRAIFIILVSFALNLFFIFPFLRRSFFSSFPRLDSSHNIIQDFVLWRRVDGFFFSPGLFLF